MAKQQTAHHPQENPVADAEQILAVLDAERRNLAAERAADDASRSKVAFRAHALHELEASRSLREIADRARGHDERLRELDCAIAEAGERLAAAKTAEVRKANQQRAAELRKLASELGEVFPYVDKHLTAAANGLIAIHDGVAKLHAAGFAFPSDNQVRINLAGVIETWAHSLPRSLHNQLRDGVRFLPPGTRKSAAQYWAAIEATLNNSISGAVDAGVKSPAMQRPDARDRQERAAAIGEFLGGGV